MQQQQQRQFFDKTIPSKKVFYFFKRFTTMTPTIGIGGTIHAYTHKKIKNIILFTLRIFTVLLLPCCTKSLKTAARLLVGTNDLLDGGNAVTSLSRRARCLICTQAVCAFSAYEYYHVDEIKHHKTSLMGWDARRHNIQRRCKQTSNVQTCLPSNSGQLGWIPVELLHRL